MSRLQFDKYAFLSRKGFCWEYALLSQNGFHCKYAPFGVCLVQTFTQTFRIWLRFCADIWTKNRRLAALYQAYTVALGPYIVPIRWRSDGFEEIGSEVVEVEEVRPSSSTRWTILVPCSGLVSCPPLLTFVEIVLRGLLITFVCREVSTSVWCWCCGESKRHPAVENLAVRLAGRLL